MTLEQKLDSLSDSVKWIESYLKNDDSTGQIGVIAKLNDVVDRLDKIERRQVEIETERRMSRAVWGVGGGSVVVLIWKIIDIVL